jgi:hypothetical protein
MALHITRPTPNHPALSLSASVEMIEVDVLDHDGAPVATLTKRAWDCAGAACIDLAATPRTVRIGVNGRPYVRLSIGELAGMRLRGDARYWLGVA